MSSNVPRRVVVTGLGLVTCLGGNASSVWRRLLLGECGITALPTLADISKLESKPAAGTPQAAAQWWEWQLGEQMATWSYDRLPCRYAGRVSETGFREARFTDLFAGRKDAKSLSRAAQFGVMAAAQALDAGHLRLGDAFAPADARERLLRQRTGVSLGVGMDGLEEILEVQSAAQRNAKGYRAMPPHFLLRTLNNMAAGHVALRWRLGGPCLSANTACATGAHSIGQAWQAIRDGQADAMLAGGAEACLQPLALAAFARARALSTRFNAAPAEASRPFDARRDGFVMAEGAGVLLLEAEETWRARGGPAPLAELRGYGATGDGFHLTSPDPEGAGAARCMRQALTAGQLDCTALGYVNAHATSTPQGDAAESLAVARLLAEEGRQADSVPVSSCKGALGHLVGAAGAVEAALTVLAVAEGRIPATCNLARPDTGVALDYVLGAERSRAWPTADGRPRVALSNSFGFGGTNASLCFSSFIP